MRSPCSDPQWTAELDRCVAHLGMIRNVRILISDDDIIPMAWGLLRPVILLPAGCANWDPRRRRIVLLHELAHIQRLDYASQLLARVAAAVYWFNPLAWYGLFRLRIECERACDDCVVNAGERVVDYAAELVDIAAAHRIPRLGEAVCMARHCQLVERVASMLDASCSHRPLSHRGTVCTIAAAGLLSCIAVAIQPVVRNAVAAETDAVASSPSAEKEAAEPQPPKTDALGDPLPDAALLRMGTIRFRHPSGIAGMALSPDEKRVVTMDSDLLIAWDAVTGKELWRKDLPELTYRFPAASYGVRAIAFAPHSQTFYTPGRKDEFITWDVTTGDYRVIDLKPEPAVPQVPIRRGLSRSVDISPDNQMLAIGSSLELAVCDKAGKVLYWIDNNPDQPIKAEDMNRDRLHFGGDFSYGRFSPDGKLLAVVNSESPQEIRLHEAKSGKELRRIPLTDNLVRLAFSPDSRQIVATERDSAARLYDVATGDKLWDYKIELKNNAESYTLRRRLQSGR